MKSSSFWDITVCSPLKVNQQRFKETCRKQAACHLLLCWFLTRLILRPWKMKVYVPPKRRSTFNRLHGVISQKIILFITTAVRTSNPTVFPYGKATQYIRWFEKLLIKKTRLLHTLPFLLRCRDQSTIPCFLQFQHHIRSVAAKRIYRCTNFYLLCEHVHHTRQ
jgi:hypothetical protein